MDKARDTAAAQAKQIPARPPGMTRLRTLLLAGGFIQMVLIVVAGAEFLAGGAPALPRMYYAPSTSMQPTIREGEWFFVAMGYYAWHQPRRGDVVVYTPPNEGSVVFIKRIVALGGDRIAVVKSRAVVNGVPMEEPYIAAGDVASSYNNMPETTVPNGSMFVLGDNRSNSADSRMRTHGPVPVDSLIGRASYIMWPQDLDRFGNWIGTP